MEIPILKSSARISSRLNYLCPQFFPAHGFWSLRQINNFSFESNESCEVCSKCLIKGITFQVQVIISFKFQDFAILISCFSYQDSSTLCESISAENLLKVRNRLLQFILVSHICGYKLMLYAKVIRKT